jgi:hypothetical protein
VVVACSTGPSAEHRKDRFIPSRVRSFFFLHPRANKDDLI